LTLLAKDDSYAGLYLDLVKGAGDLLDTYFWLDRPEAFDLRTPLQEIKQTASAALAEFDKVASIKKGTAGEVKRVTGKAADALHAIQVDSFAEIGQFVTRLAELRGIRGELISLRELRYVDLPLVEKTERDVIAAADALAQRTVNFLLGPNALDPFRARVEALQAAVPALPKATDAQKLEDEINGVARELDLLVETAGNLKMQDATETTRIIESVSMIYAVINQSRAALKQKLRELRGHEAVAEFGAQTRLLDQGLANYLDLCATPEKCDEYLNRLMVQIEELEARFADFDEFVIQLSEKRTAAAGAFESRKIELIEARNRKAQALFTAGERILAGIKHRADRLASLDEINGYFASDLMVEKVREQIGQLLELGDSVKGEDLQTRLKTVREDGVRQLKDRQELFAGGPNLIQLGRHRFVVNTQELDLTVVQRGGEMCLHVAGTNFFEPIQDEAFLATRPVWPLEVASETPEIYRGEYLAFKMLGTLESEGRIEAAAKWIDEERVSKVRELMAPRYAEGYVKGVHDADAATILGALLEMHTSIGLLRYPTQARACAAVFWHQFPEGERKALLTAKLRGYATMKQLFPSHQRQAAYTREVHGLLSEWALRTGLFEERWLAEAAEYLYFQVKRNAAPAADAFVVSREAAELLSGFQRHLTAHHFAEAFRAARESVEGDLPSAFELLRDWMRGYVSAHGGADQQDYVDEAAALLLRGSTVAGHVSQATTERDLTGLRGHHSTIQEGRLRVSYIRFMQRLRAHDTLVVPQFERFQQLKKQLIDRARDRLRIESFKPKVLTSFVRNRLIDAVYLPLVGDNLAKQIGAAGDAKRTDRMGLLLLVSPPGYGKTTLLEYVASRLGIVFMKVNGPAIGHRVTSLDPAEAPNASARDELDKLNLAFEMGDNVMVCLDDIQHLHAEFLQKFISLTDGSRRIEGVYRGEPRTYDLRGRKVVVAMAGNPYTETGEKFEIPDMLANRADTYNLGDVIGGHIDAFKTSYLENAATSNPTLARLAGRSHKDLNAIVQLAEGGSREGVELESTWSPEELSEFVGVTKKLLRVRDVVLRVNEEYIRSAAQADAYRTEPPFKLQGSYRNMNRLAEKVSPVMNDAELEALLQGHYRNEAQTLTKGAEANLLKLKELTNALSPQDAARWEEIKKTFRKNQVLGAGNANSPVTQVVQRLAACYDGIDAIREVLAAGLKNQMLPPSSPPVTLIIAPPASVPLQDGEPRATGAEGIRELQIDQETLKKIWEVIEEGRIAGSPEVTGNGENTAPRADS
ncbi:MAG: AAA family ATPase, partial [Verrucomicrobiota bacterium]|nr:AAA family ATPase [Verrucomicrobiota bacterium]